MALFQSVSAIWFLYCFPYLRFIGGEKKEQRWEESVLTPKQGVGGVVGRTVAKGELDRE